LLWLVFAFFLIFVFYESLPSLAKHVPWRYEQRLLVATPLVDSKSHCTGSPDANRAFDVLLRRIYPVYPDDGKFPVEVEFIKGTTVNAFAFLAGRIFVYDGLVQQADSPEELAAVLAHEIEHIKERHITQAMIQRTFLYAGALVAFPHSGLGSLGALLDIAAKIKFSRFQEEQADDGALDRLKVARINIQGFKNFFSKRSHSSALGALLSDHPSDESRFQKANAFPVYDSEPLMSAAEWAALKGICR
jgi:Zn-dependent protease with chaperone function